MMTNHHGSNLRNATQLFASLKLKKFFSSDIEIVRLKEKKLIPYSTIFSSGPTMEEFSVPLTFGQTDILVQMIIEWLTFGPKNFDRELMLIDRLVQLFLLTSCELS